MVRASVARTPHADVLSASAWHTGTSGFSASQLFTWHMHVRALGLACNDQFHVLCFILFALAWPDRLRQETVAVNMVNEFFHGSALLCNT